MEIDETFLGGRMSEVDKANGIRISLIRITYTKNPPVIAEFGAVAFDSDKCIVFIQEQKGS